MLECAPRMNTRWKSFTPWVNSRVDNILDKIAPDLNQPLFQYIIALDGCAVNTPLNGRPYLAVE